MKVFLRTEYAVWTDLDPVTAWISGGMAIGPGCGQQTPVKYQSTEYALTPYGVKFETSGLDVRRHTSQNRAIASDVQSKEYTKTGLNAGYREEYKVLGIHAV